MQGGLVFCIPLYIHLCVSFCKDNYTTYGLRASPEYLFGKCRLVGEVTLLIKPHNMSVSASETVYLEKACPLFLFSHTHYGVGISVDGLLFISSAIIQEENCHLSFFKSLLKCYLLLLSCFLWWFYPPHFVSESLFEFSCSVSPKSESSFRAQVHMNWRSQK